MEAALRRSHLVVETVVFLQHLSFQALISQTGFLILLFLHAVLIDLLIL